MKVIKGFAYATLTAAMLGGFTACDDDDDKSSDNEELKYFATTDMTWAEFYAGELDQNASALEADGYDAVTSATKNHPANFSGCVMLSDSSTITGVKAVNVAMTESVYKSLSESEKARYTFYSDTTFSEYKQLNKGGKFGKLVNGETKQTASTSLTCGSDARWNNYVISLSGDELDLSSMGEAKDLKNLMGAILTTSDGSKYGLKPMYNLWINTKEFGFSIKEFNEVHGYPVGYQHTATLEGKTVTNLTYLVKDGNNISIDMNVYVKKQTTASVTAGSLAAGTNATVSLSIEGAPSDANYTLAAVKTGSGRGQKALTSDDYSYSNGVLTINEVTSGTVYSVSFADEKYVNIGASFTAE